MAFGVDTILVSFNPCDQNGDEILIVGRKEPGKKDATIINAFQGKERHSFLSALSQEAY